MVSTLSLKPALFTISKVADPRLSMSVTSFPTRPLRCIFHSNVPIPFNSLSPLLPVWRPSRTATSFASGGRGGVEFGGDSGGGGCGGDGGDAKGKAVAPGAEEVSALSPNVIVLDVGPQVSSGSVNLTTGTAVVRPLSEAKYLPNWQKELGGALAKHLTNCGFL